MKIPEYIKLAVEKQDWMAICEVYTKLTGQPLYPPLKNQQEKNEIDEINDIEMDEASSIGTDLMNEIQQSIIVDTQSSSSPATSKRINRFTDNLDVDSKLLKTNNPELMKLYKTNIDRTKNNRPLVAGRQDTSNMVNVQCSLCQRKMQVASVLAFGYNKNPDENTFRCNDCSTPSGIAKALKNNG
jgi:hypothetical protein